MRVLRVLTNERRVLPDHHARDVHQSEPQAGHHTVYNARFENPAFATFLIIRITYAGSRQIEREPASKLRVQPVMAET